MNEKRDLLFARLKQIRSQLKNLSINDLFTLNPKRFEEFSTSIDDMLLDYSKVHINKDVLLWFLFWILWITSANIIGIFYQNKQGIYNTKGNLIITGSNLDLLYISIFIFVTIIAILQ